MPLKKFLLLILFSALTLLLSGQDSKLVDSLENKIDNLLTDQTDTSYFLWLSYYDLVDQYEMLNQPKKAAEAFDNSIKFAPNDTFKHRSYYRRIVWFAEQHNSEQTMSLASEMLKEFPEYEAAKTNAYMFMAVAHEHKNDPENAILYYEKSLESAIKSKDSSNYYMVMINMANTIFDSGDKARALNLYKMGLDYYSKQAGNEQHILSLLNNIGTGYMGVNSDSVFKYLLAVKEKSKDIANPWNPSLASLNLGLEYFSIGKPDQAEKELRSSLAGMNQLNEQYYHYEIYRVLAAIESYRSNWSLSMKLLDSSKYFSDLIDNESRNQEFALAKTEFGLVEEELKNQLLVKEKLETENIIKWQYISGGLILILLLGVLGFVLKQKKQSSTINELNIKLKEKNQELDKFLQEKDNLMGILFHDIRSPMAAIQTVATFVEVDDQSNIDPHTKELLGEMKRVSEQGLKLVDNIWSIYELENNSTNVVFAEINLSTIFKEIALEFESNGTEKNIKLNIDCAQLTLKTNEHLLTSIIRNLISNAFKFSPSDSIINLNASEKNTSIEIRVNDQGPGFNTEDQKMMFNKFQKLSAKPLHGEKSSGLGLYLVTLIATKIGANIKLNNKYKNGAEFIISIPKNKI